MRLWSWLLAAEFAKLRRLVVLRAVAGSLLVGPAVIILVLRLVATDITRVVRSPLEVVLGSGVLMAGFGCVVLAASVLGREFDLGTTRVQLSRGAPRAGLLLAKAVATVLMISVASLLASAVGVVGVVLVGWATGLPEAVAVLVRSTGLVLLISLAYTGSTFLGAILGRSSAAALLAGLLMYLGDFLLLTVRSRIPFGEWMPMANLFVLLGETYSSILPPVDLPTTGTAALRLAGVGLGLILGSIWVFKRQDVTG